VLPPAAPPEPADPPLDEPPDPVLPPVAPPACMPPVLGLLDPPEPPSDDLSDLSEELHPVASAAAKTRNLAWSTLKAPASRALIAFLFEL